MTHDELVERGARWLRSQGCHMVLREFCALTYTGEIPDVLGWKNGQSVLIEAKASRSDFLADKHKPFRKDPALGIGQWRLYIAPPGMIKVEELPEGWGLLEVRGKIVKVLGPFPRVYTMQPFFSPGANPKRYLAWHDAPPFAGNPRAEMSTLLSAHRRLQVLLGAEKFDELVHQTFAETQAKALKEATA